MNTSTFFDMTGRTQGYTRFFRQQRTASGSSDFGLSGTQQPAHTFIQGPDIHLRMGENILCSGSFCGQSYTAEYTADSTAEDPIVRISGTSSSGAFDFTCHIRGIDPSNASYVELRALNSYLCRTGAYQTQYKNKTGALPVGMECGDIARKENYLTKIETFIASSSKSGVYPKLDPTAYAHARELLGVYQSFAQERDGWINEPRQSEAQALSSYGVQRSSSRTVEESAFSKYLDVDVQRQKMWELPPGQTLDSVYMQFMSDYREWKAQQPELNLPDSQGWTDENLAFLRERYGEGDLSANEIYDALSTMRDMGILSEKGKDCAVGITWIKVNLSDSGICAVNVDPDSRAAWLHGFDEAPMVGFHSLEDIFSWAKEFREEDYPDYMTRAEALARGWI